VRCYIYFTVAYVGKNHSNTLLIGEDLSVNTGVKYLQAAVTVLQQYTTYTIPTFDSPYRRSAINSQALGLLLINQSINQYIY